MKKYTLFLATLVFSFGCVRSNKPTSNEMLVFCAASLNEVITEIADSFKVKTGTQVNLNFASSGTLARQIENGASPSLYISANKKWVAYLNDLEKTLPEKEFKLAGNQLVVITPRAEPIDSFAFDEACKFAARFHGRLAIGDPKHVPAGEYAVQALTHLQLFGDIENRLLPAKDVRSALMLVELGETKAGIVYKTDALKSKKVKIAAEIPESCHQPIAYYVAVLKNENEITRSFYTFLKSETSKACWLKNGFTID